MNKVKVAKRIQRARQALEWAGEDLGSSMVTSWDSEAQLASARVAIEAGLAAVMSGREWLTAVVCSPYRVGIEGQLILEPGRAEKITEAVRALYEAVRLAEDVAHTTRLIQGRKAAYRMPDQYTEKKGLEILAIEVGLAAYQLDKAAATARTMETGQDLEEEATDLSDRALTIAHRLQDQADAIEEEAR